MLFALPDNVSDLVAPSTTRRLFQSFHRICYSSAAAEMQRDRISERLLPSRHGSRARLRATTTRRRAGELGTSAQELVTSSLVVVVVVVHVTREVQQSFSYLCLDFRLLFPLLL